MPRKPDILIEAVRYKNGQVQMVRAYERRGATFSDWVLIERKALVERLQKGEQFFLGSRENFKASTFNLGPAVLLLKKDGHELIATRADAAHDELEGSPVF